MSGKQKSGGGQKKIGRNKIKCATYKNQGVREKAKIKSFAKHNIPKDASLEEEKKLISSFKELQDKRKKKVTK